MRFEFRMKLPSVANLREHPMAKAERNKRHRSILHWEWRKATRGPDAQKWSLPAVVTMTRVAPRELDDDNNVSAFKAIRDQIAAELGQSDRSPLIAWRYAQRKGAESVVIEISP